MDQKIKDELQKPLDARNVKERSQSGRSMSYVEGWLVIAEANRIFGFDGWNRETIEMREVRPPELVKSSNGKETWRVGFIAKVRLTIGATVREGSGYGAGALPDLGEAYESAIKEAETDAMKRAFMTLGNPFGLALYDKTQANVATAPKEPSTASAAPVLTKLKKSMREMKSQEDLRRWFVDNDVKALRQQIPADWDSTLKQEMADYAKTLPAAPTNAYADNMRAG